MAAARRISKSSVDWARMASLVKEFDKQHFNAFKAKSTAYVSRVQSLPETPPALNFAAVKSQISDPAIVDAIEKSYKAALASIPYPKDTKSHEVDAQEKEQLAFAEIIEQRNARDIKEADELIEKFQLMIPYDRMTKEDWALTFPDWSWDYKEPTIWPHRARWPDVTPETKKHWMTPDDPPYALH